MAIQDEIPKSRLTLTYKTQIEGEAETVDLPLRLLFLGDFSLGTSKDRQDDLDDRRLRKLDGSNLDQIMEDMNINLSFSVANKIDKGGDDITVDIPITSMRSFGPDEIVKHVPKLRGFMTMKRMLEQIQSDMSNVKKLRTLLAEAYRDKEVYAALREELAEFESLKLPVAEAGSKIETDGEEEGRDE